MFLNHLYYMDCKFCVIIIIFFAVKACRLHLLICYYSLGVCTKSVGDLFR